MPDVGMRLHWLHLSHHEDRTGSAPRRRTTQRPPREDDHLSLMQNTKNGKQLGPIPPHEALKTAQEVLTKIDGVINLEERTLLKLDLKARALRNLKSKVPAVRDVSEQLLKQLQLSDKRVQGVKHGIGIKKIDKASKRNLISIKKKFDKHQKEI